MSEPTLDELLRGCESEPIHVPGAVQPHGCLLAVDDAGTVRFASANVADVVGPGGAEALGRPLAAVVGAEVAAAAGATGPQRVRGADGGDLDVLAHDVDGLRVVEIEPSAEVDLGDDSALVTALLGVQHAPTVERLATQAVAAVAELTGFDRVMAYRFDADWNGEVIAEVARAGLEPFLGLRYPAADIPAQARELYRRNRLRLIVDVDYAPAPIEPTSPALDLSDATLRSVSPVHLEYLRAMGVTASMSASLLDGDRLWGLIACHHGQPRRPSQRLRAAVDVVARTTSTLLSARTDADRAESRLAASRVLDRLLARLADDVGQDPAGVLVADGDDLLAVVGATGAVVRVGGTTRVVGTCPPPAVVDAVLDAADGRPSVDDRLAAGPDAAGALAVPVDASGTRWLAFFRPEVLQEVRWAGDPREKRVEATEAGLPRLGPRRSFATYVEQVRGRSLPWTPVEVDAARTLADALGDAVARRARREAEVAAALQRAVLLDRLPSIPGLDVAARYRPDGHHPIGGDWYDLFFRPDGVAVLAMGDVAGHGAEVAGTMAQLRHALRAYVIQEATAGAAMGRLDELMRMLLPGQMATAVLAVLDPSDGVVDIVSAGHLPPVLVTDGTAGLLELPRHPALGLRLGATYQGTEVVLPRQATLVLCTDGLIERRDVPLDERLDRLAEEAASVAGRTADDVCDHLVAAMAPADPDDDMTVLALRFTGVAATATG